TRCPANWPTNATHFAAGSAWSNHRPAHDAGHTPRRGAVTSRTAPLLHAVVEATTDRAVIDTTKFDEIFSARLGLCP
ncbi:hypothetical protein, partial [Spelaeicoccus albus]|uniref:hypothetical protein n=1 Tax=Spelaeicoccus albus TaxID=1280376 RepID=UPI001F4683BD